MQVSIWENQLFLWDIYKIATFDYRRRKENWLWASDNGVTDDYSTNCPYLGSFGMISIQDTGVFPTSYSCLVHIYQHAPSENVQTPR